jgi:hypothetical protein
MGDDEVRASWSRPPVPEVGPDLPWWTEAELFWMNKVVAPVRARRVRRSRKPMPPPLTAEESARRLFTMPMSYWTYDFEPGVRHLGPMAQDFAAAFGLGRSNRQIDMVDANGVAVLAIQVLNRRVTALQKEVDRLTALVDPNVGGATSPVSAGERNEGASSATLEQPPGAAPGPHERTSAMTDEKELPEDVEAHRSYSSSDRNVKHDVTPVESEESNDDVEGHRMYSDRDIKHDVTPVTSEENDDDVEGHRFSSSDRNIKHDISPVTFERPSDEGSLGQQPQR